MTSEGSLSGAMQEVHWSLLWDRWEETVDRITRGRHDVKQMKSYFEERQKAEEAYAKELMKISAHYKEFEEKSSLNTAWKGVRNSSSMTHKQHEQLAKACGEIAKNLHVLSEDIKSIRAKNVNAYKKLSEDKMKRSKHHSTSKQKYYAAVKAAEAATVNFDAGKAQNLPDKAVQKLQRIRDKSMEDVDKSHAIYQKAVESLGEIQRMFDDKVADMMSEFQQLELKRLKAIYAQNRSFANSHDFLKGSLDQMAVFLHEGASACFPERDIVEFFQTQSTGKELPGYVAYEPCVSERIGHMTDANARALASQSAGTNAPAPSLARAVGGGVGPPAGTPPAAASRAAPTGEREYAASLYEFESTEADDLPFAEGVKILLLHCDESEDWWQGELNGKKGMFPKSYVKKLKPGEQVQNAPTQNAFQAGEGQVGEEQVEGGTEGAGAGADGDTPRVMNARCEALFDFEGQDADDLSFKAGDQLIITGELDGWYLGKLENGERTGIFPSNYVSIKS